MPLKPGSRTAPAVRWMAGWAVLAISVLGIIPGGLAWGQATSPPGPATVVSSSTPLPAPLVLFEDDFSTYSRRWSEQDSPKSQVGVRGGALVMRVVSPGVHTWSIPDFSIPPGPYTVEMRMTFRESSSDSWAGCLLSVLEGPSFLAFGVTRGGAWQFQQVVEGDWQTIARGRVRREADQDRLDLRIDRGEDWVALWIDGVMVRRFPVDRHWSGRMFGAMARAGRGHVEVAVERVVVTQLASGTDVVGDEQDG